MITYICYPHTQKWLLLLKQVKESHIWREHLCKCRYNKWKCNEVKQVIRTIPLCRSPHPKSVSSDWCQSAALFTQMGHIQLNLTTRLTGQQHNRNNQLEQYQRQISGHFQRTKKGAELKVINTRNKSIVPRRTMHTGRILSRAYAAIREWS